MDEETMQARSDALAFLKRHKTGVISTVSPQHEAHGSVVYYTADDNFNIYFLTLVSTRKFAALSAHPQIAFTVAVPDIPQTLQLEGIAVDISLDDEAVKQKDELIATLNSNEWFYGPITKLDLSEVVVIWVRPTWVRWADYAFAPQGSDHVFKQIPLQ